MVRSPAGPVKGGGQTKTMSIFPTLKGAAPKIIAHRGASGTLPEHTLEAYALAIELGADYIEPDLVFTKDGHLIARHDGYLSTSTNVSQIPRYQGRRRFSKAFQRDDWFTEDFTLKEIKTLKSRQTFPGRSNEYDDKFLIPTFEEILALALKKSKGRDTPVGVYPETKKPGHYKKLGHDFVPPLLGALKDAGLDQASDRIVIQSFDFRILIRLSNITPLPLVFLLEENFRAKFLLPLFTRFVAGIGPAKELLVREGKSTGFLEAAHRAGLEVHPYTFRRDQVGTGFADFEAELEFYYRLGVDALFTDFTDIAVTVREKLS